MRGRVAGSHDGCTAIARASNLREAVIVVIVHAHHTGTRCRFPWPDPVEVKAEGTATRATADEGPVKGRNEEMKGPQRPERVGTRRARQAVGLA